MKRILFGLFLLLSSVQLEAQISVITTDTSSPNACDGSAFLSDTVPNTNFYSWYDNANNLVFQGGNYVDSLCAGNYILIVTMFDGTTSTYTFIIQEGNGVDCSSLQLVAVIQQQPSSPTSLDGIVTAYASGGTEPYTYLWFNGSTAQTATGLSPGFFQVCVSDMNGCFTCTDGYLVLDSTDCSGFSVNVVQTQNATMLNDGVAEVTISGGSGPYVIYQYNNNDVDSIVSNGPSTYSVLNLSAGQLCVTVTDLMGCYAEDCIAIVSDTIADPCDSFVVSVIVNQNASSPFAADGSLTAVASGALAPYTYSWSNAMSGSTISNLPVGSYQVCATSSDGCSVCEYGFITYDSIIDPCNGFYATASTTNTSSPANCDGTVTITPVGGLPPYQLLMNGVLYSNLTVSNLCPGNYNPIVTDSQGCGLNVQFFVSSDQDTITYPLVASVYTINTSFENICDGTAFYAVSGGVPPYAYINVDGEMVGQSEIGLCEGVYSTTIVDASGQIFVLNYFIASPDNIIDNTSFEDSLVVDTLFNSVLENCIIDFLTLDTAYISNIEFVSLDSIVVTWSIIDGSGTIEIIESYSLNSGFGVYELILQIFCPQRATDKYLIVIEQFRIGGSFAGIADQENTGALVYPNPIQDQLLISLPNVSETRILITDISGKKVYESIENDSLIQINTSGFANGQYVVHIENDSQRLTKKVIK